MCIIVYKPKKTQMPCKKTLSICFDNNPDGAGFMYVDQGKVNIEKGFETFGEFWAALRQHERLWHKAPFVLHFRISTQAGVRKDCTHPFPLSKNMDDLRKLKYRTNIGIAHNGIIDLTSTWGYKTQVDYSDTMKFITDYLTLIVDNEYYYKDRNKVALIKKLIDSKFAVLDRFNHCELIGDFVEDNGIYYSNRSYKPKKVTAYQNMKIEDYMKPAPKASWADSEAEYYYDQSTNMYYFNDLECPYVMDNDTQYCTLCASHDHCYGNTEPYYTKNKLNA